MDVAPYTRPLRCRVAFMELVLVAFMQALPAWGLAPDLHLTFPAGRSPRVFTSGWSFGASATVDGKDLSDQVRWSGTGQFSPARGRFSRPVFRGPGPNRIILTLTVKGRDLSRTFDVQAVSPERYACVGDLVQSPACAHGCPACPHPVTGRIETGSASVQVRGRPAARVGDGGTHARCCGANTFKIVAGDESVLIDGRPAARRGDRTLHCGSSHGQIGGKAGGGLQADGTWVGATTPALCTGALRLEISGERVTGSYSGRSPADPSVQLATRWTGTYSPPNSMIQGEASGSKQTATRTEPLGGRFTGSLAQGQITGTWYMTFQGQTLGVPFRLERRN